MKKLQEIWSWIFCLGEKEKPVKDSAEKLQNSMRVTAKCRYNAAVRLQRQGKFAFFTTTALSLGLIFVPLMQTSGVKLAFEPNVLNMMQIFLAVSVLVYSVVIGTARYDVRAETLTECGDKLKELIRSIDKHRETNEKFSETNLTNYHERYSDIVTDTENHIRSDYGLAVLEMEKDYFYTGLIRLKLWVTSHLHRLIPYILPVVLLSAEVTFITDMVGASSVLPKYLNGEAVQAANGKL
ncbi:MAG: SLATT domain-containing protein [Colwellia sp.]|nr:SLATT domain-containing protein [Colwellia sp.]